MAKIDLYNVYWLQYYGTNVFLMIGNERYQGEQEKDHIYRVLELDTKKNTKIHAEQIKWAKNNMPKAKNIEDCLIADQTKWGCNNYYDPPIINTQPIEDGEFLIVPINEDMPLFKNAKKYNSDIQAETQVAQLIGTYQDYSKLNLWYEYNLNFDA